MHYLDYILTITYILRIIQCHQFLLHHYLPYDYCSIDYFGFDPLDFDNINGPFIDDPDLQTFNADWKAALFINNVTEIAKMYKVNHILVPTGCDFQYQNAHQNFRSIDKLIAYVNSKYTNVSLFYSTPSQFFQAIKDAQISFPTRYGDMFPYQSEQDNFWTGFFTSRPGLKKQIRDGSALLHQMLRHYSSQAINLLTTQQEMDDIQAATNKMYDTMGLLMHHDAITGTDPGFVADNYGWKLSKAKSQMLVHHLQEVQKQASDIAKVTSTQWQFCSLTNTSYLDCPNSQYKNSSFLVLINNPSMHPVYYSKVKLPHQKFVAQIWNTTLNQFTDLNQVILCHNYTDEFLKVLKDCELNLETEIKELESVLIQISYNFDLEKKNRKPKHQKEILTDQLLQRYSYVAEYIFIYLKVREGLYLKLT